MSFNKIPSEIFTYEIFQYLPIDSIVRLGSVNKFLNSIIRNNTGIVDNVNLTKAIIVTQKNIYEMIDDGISEESLDRIIPKFRYLIEINKKHLFELFQDVLYFAVNIRHIYIYDEIYEIENVLFALDQIHGYLNDKRKELGLRDFFQSKLNFLT